MKKKWIIILVISVVLAGGIFASAKIINAHGKKTAAKIVTSDEVDKTGYGFFYYKDKIYALQSADQKKYVEEHTDVTDVSVKEILKYLGVMEEEPDYTLKNIKEALSKLDANAGCQDVLAALDSVAGACDVEGGSGVTYYIYTKPDQFYIRVEMSGQVSCSDLTDPEYQGKVIFYRGLGFNEEGWTLEQRLEYKNSKKY